MYTFTIILILCLLSTLVSLYYVSRRPQCGGTLDPTMRYCDPVSSRLVTGSRIPEAECNPVTQIQKMEMATQFVEYMKRINLSATLDTQLLSILQTSFPQANMYQGSLFFAIPPLLKLLASDFGQNELTPYGIVSFSDIYLKSCISNPSSFCRNVAKGNELVDALCQQYIIHLGKQSVQQCPFKITDGNPDLRIHDIGFFDLIGSLGTFSLQYSQSLVLYYDFPVGSLPLNYWSFNLYLADRLAPEACSPFRQTYLASLTPPLNCFMTPSIANKKFNPITGQGDLISPNRIRFYLIVSLSEDKTTEIMNSLKQNADKMPFDFIHVFKVPTRTTSMVIDPSLPNPNRLGNDTPMYNPRTDRLSLFLRLSPDPLQEDTLALKNFVNGNIPFSKNFCQICLVDFGQGDNEKINQQLLYGYQQPKYINPIINEKATLKSAYDTAIHSFRSSLYPKYSLTKLALRNSVLNIFAPLFSTILSTNKPYMGGWQAIQLAGCAQADNPDTQYRLSGSACLSIDDAMIAVALNHARLGNCLYNNMNIIDLNKAFSVGSVTLTKDIDIDLYIVVVGRNVDVVDSMISLLRLKVKSDLKIGYYPIYIQTGPSIDGGVPMCHQILMVERVYVNMQYPSSKVADIEYNLHDIYGSDLKQINYKFGEDGWSSLVNVAAPDLATLIAPLYFKTTFPSYKRTILYVCLGILIGLLASMMMYTKTIQ